jgi:hypothetical protein
MPVNTANQPSRPDREPAPPAWTLVPAVLIPTSAFGRRTPKRPA